MKPRILFLCTHNSARSQMAEAIINSQFGEQFEAMSAGTKPRSNIDPKALTALENMGLSTEGLYTKAVSDLTEQRFDYAITLCHKAHQQCRGFANADQQLTWDFPDPTERGGAKPFETTLKEIHERIKIFALIKSKASAKSTLDPVQFYKALADDTRLKCLLLITQQQELCVCELTETLQQSQPKISRHLAQLKQTGLLSDRRQGQWIYYGINSALPNWAQTVLHISADENIEFLSEANRHLLNMGDRPERQLVCCKEDA